MELLNSVNFQGKDYMFGTLMPKLSSYAMLGEFASFTVLNVIVVFDNNSLYFFAMSRLSNKKIVSVMTVPFNQITGFKVSRVLFGIAKKIHLNISGYGKLILQVNNKVKNLNNQANSIQNLLQVLPK